MNHHPPAAREDLVEEMHGHRVADPYRWLENDEDARTRAFVALQDEHFQAARRAWPDQAGWERSLAARTQARSVAPPVIRGTRRFVLTQAHDSPHPALLVSDTASGARHELDLGAASSGEQGEPALVRGFRPSWEGDRFVCTVSTGGSDRVTQQVLDTATGEAVEPPLGPLPAAWVAWLPGGEAFYYVAYARPSAERTSVTDLRVRLHRVGTDPSLDPVVFPEDGSPAGYCGLTIDPAGRWLAVTVSDGAVGRNALWLAGLSSGPARPQWRQVTDDAFGAAVAPRFAPDGRLCLMTDHGAPRGRVCVVDPAEPHPGNWLEAVPEDGEAVLDDCVLLDTEGGPRALALRTRHGVSELSLYGPGPGARPVTVGLPGAGVASSLRVDPRGGHEALMLYSDFATPAAVHRYDVTTGSLTRWVDVPQPRETPGPRITAGPTVRSRLVDYTASDGTTVRMFLLTADGDWAGPRPTIISGYGGFGVPLRPLYSPVVSSWLAAGGRYALPCVRGGGDEGKAWHEAGRGRRKTVSVDDFTAAAEWLVGRGWTEPGMLAAAGASHGGFLVAAAAMRRPDLFAAVLCADPLLDMVRYQRLGIGATWTEEFGSADEPAGLADLLALSPYHQVREGTAYPAMLFSGGTDDPRLGAAHVRKMCAALQYAAAPSSPVLMRREAGVGHGARTPLATHELNTDTLAFLGMHTGLRPAAGPGHRRPTERVAVTVNRRVSP